MTPLFFFFLQPAGTGVAETWTLIPPASATWTQQAPASGNWLSVSPDNTLWTLGDTPPIQLGFNVDLGGSFPPQVAALDLGNSFRSSGAVFDKGASL